MVEGKWSRVIGRLSVVKGEWSMMSGQKYATIGTALFAIRKIKIFLENYVENNPFINIMKNNLLERMLKYIDDRCATT